MDFPLHRLMDEQACYDQLIRVLHPDGLRCPRCGSDQANVHRRHRAPVLDYRCRGCGRVFNAFTGTVLAGTPKRPAQIMLILRGIAQGVSTARLARELALSRSHLLDLRHRLQAQAAEVRDRQTLPDQVVEADEMYQNAGEKRRAAPRTRRSAQATGQQAPRPRHVGEGPSADPGRGRTRERAHPAAGAATQHAGTTGRTGAPRHAAGNRGQHR